MIQGPLKLHTQFQQILQNYRVSASAEALLKEIKLVLLLAPSSTGRNTIIRQLVDTEHYHYIISDTTRQPRVNDGVQEQNGKEYWFKSEEEVLAGLQAGEYLEAEVLHNQQVSGISMRELELAKNEQKVAITDVDIQGVHNILRAKPDTVVVLLLPPSFDELLRRMSQRGVMRGGEERRRLETAAKIFEDGVNQHYYRYVIAEDIKQSAGIIDSIASGGHNPYQDRGPELIRQLQEQLREKLASSF
ncbi:MAG TPA: hypothetical protein VMT23_02615 [Candidatus Binatia bacterium]|nr:hypothetical protein [Candidatus Binatia bacterium]